tara:strand:- start:45 stop:1199 length:1155 start_codon:yes stop_codon:yes gene_type:complete
MKVIILGGCGGMGRYASKTISSFDQIQMLTIADLHKEDAEEFANQLGSHVKGIGLDINNKKLLHEALRSFNVVVNTVGPFFRYGYEVLKTSLDANCHYIDICDDWEPTERMLELDHLAKKRGLLAILGMGASPGITNLLGAIAINELDEAETIYTGWSMDEAKPEDISSQKQTNAAMIHGIEQISGKVKIYQDKKFQMTKPLKEIEINYPRRGNFKASIFGHPEAVTFPKHYKNLKASMNLVHGDILVMTILRIINKLIGLKLLSKISAARFLDWLERNSSSNNSEHQNSLPEIYALAIGSKNNKLESVGVSYDGAPTRELSMGDATGLPLALGLKMFIEGEIPIRGVISPESQDIDHRKMLLEICNLLGIRDASIKIDRSWEC